MRFWMSLFSLGSSDEVGFLFLEVVSPDHHVQYLCWYRFPVEYVSSSRDVLFLGCVGVLLANPCIVFQRVCVLCL